MPYLAEPLSALVLRAQSSLLSRFLIRLSGTLESPALILLWHNGLPPFLQATDPRWCGLL